MKTKHSKRNHGDESDECLKEDWPEPAKSSDFYSSDASSTKVSKKSKKRKKKRDSSSESDSDQSEKESTKKRKHKKKKKKHSKKKRHVSSDDSDSDSDNDVSSELSEDTPPVKRKHKHKHKHSSKRRPDSEKTYAENAPPRSDDRDQRSYKLKSVCKEREPQKNYHAASGENIISSDDDHFSRSKRDVEYAKRPHPSNHIKIEISPERTSSKHHPRLPRVEPPESDSVQNDYYKNNFDSRAHRNHSQGEMYGHTRPKFDGDRYHANKPFNRPHNQQFYDNDRQNDGGNHKYRDNSGYKNDGNDFYNNGHNDGQAPRRQSYDGGRFQNNNKFDDRRANNDRYQGNSYNRGSDHGQSDRFDDHRQQGSGFNRRPQNNYSQQNSYNRDNNRPDRQDGGYQRNKDFQQRNEQGGNRYQDKNDLPSSSQHYGRRYDDHNVNDRKNSSKEDSPPASSGRDTKDDRSATRKRTEPSDRKPDSNREEKEESGSRRQKFPRREKSEDNDNYEWGKKSNTDAADDSKAENNAADKEKPNFGLSGKLTEDTNMVNGVVIKYSEPPEARQPKRRWRFYPFKGDKALPILYIHRQSCFLLGRDRKVTDIPLDHPSVSKQHAALQYRLVPFTRDDGSTGKRVRPYIIDLGSANGTFVNNKQIEPSKYVELLERDVVKFGFSQREYVLLHENSKEDGMDDDDVNMGATSDDAKPAAKTVVKKEK